MIFTSYYYDYFIPSNTHRLALTIESEPGTRLSGLKALLGHRRMFGMPSALCLKKRTPEYGLFFFFFSYPEWHK